MYPVQVMISYFTTSFTVIMHIGREVTAKQYTGGGLQDSKGTYIKKQAQEWVRLVSYRWRIVKLSATPLRNRPHMVFCSQGTS